MGGNVSEFTTEVLPTTSEPVILRSSNYVDAGPAGQRNDNNTSNANSNNGLRATLILFSMYKV